MDIVTHGLLGAVTAQSASKRGHVRVAAITGFLAAMLADADVFIRSDADPLLVLEYHRHFSHSLAFIPVGALIASVLLWPFMRRHLAWPALYGYAFLGYATAGVLDTCTSYGTRLLWPFSDTPIAWSIISVFDPTFSLFLIVSLVLAWRLRDRRWAWMGIVLAVSYLLVGVVQHQRALSVAESLAAERGQVPERVLVKPTMANLVLWRAIAVADGMAHIDAIRVGPFSGPMIYPGTTVEIVDPATWGGLPPASRAYRELQRFHGYSDALLAEHPADPHFLGDLRYAMVPTGTAPLWGIAIDPHDPDGPIAFEARRELTPEMRKKFMQMLTGK